MSKGYSFRGMADIQTLNNRQGDAIVLRVGSVIESTLPSMDIVSPAVVYEVGFSREWGESGMTVYKIAGPDLVPLANEYTAYQLASFGYVHSRHSETFDPSSINQDVCALLFGGVETNKKISKEK